jgi:hypothetical protein
MSVLGSRSGCTSTLLLIGHTIDASPGNTRERRLELIGGAGGLAMIGVAVTVAATGRKQ